MFRRPGQLRLHEGYLHRGRVGVVGNFGRRPVADHKTPGCRARPTAKSIWQRRPSPSGAGKTSLSRRLVADYADLVLSISATTRAPRPGEEESREYFFKSRPEFMCRPSGVEAEALEREKRILQTPAMIAVLNANQTYRQIFLDGRQLEKDPAPMWQGFSVGRFEGDTLVVESNRFNDSTWLNNVGLPHTESSASRALHAPEPRPPQRRRDLRRSRRLQQAAEGVRMRLVTDTEMLEESVQGQTGDSGPAASRTSKKPGCGLEQTMRRLRRRLLRGLEGQPSQGDDDARGRRAARDGPAASGGGDVDP